MRPVTRHGAGRGNGFYADPGDPRDTTSPRAMVGVMRQVLCGDVLSPASRERLLGWLRVWSVE